MQVFVFSKVSSFKGSILRMNVFAFQNKPDRTRPKKKRNCITVSLWARRESLPF